MQVKHEIPTSLIPLCETTSQYCTISVHACMVGTLHRRTHIIIEMFRATDCDCHVFVLSLLSHFARLNCWCSLAFLLCLLFSFVSVWVWFCFLVYFVMVCCFLVLFCFSVCLLLFPSLVRMFFFFFFFLQI